MPPPTATLGIDATVKAGGELANAVSESFKGMFETLKTFETPAKIAGDAFKKMGELMKEIGTRTTDLVTTSLRKFSDALAPVGDRLRTLGDIVKFTFTNTVERAREALYPLTDTVKALFENITVRASDALRPLGDAIERNLKPITSRIGQFIRDKISSLPIGSGGYRAGGTAGGALGGAATVAKGIGAVAGGAGAALGAVIGLGQAIGGLVAKASPAHFERFQLVMADLSAVVGRALIPVFEVITSVIRTAGDTVATFANTIGSVLGTIANAIMPVIIVQFEMFGHIGQAVGNVLKSLAPAFASIGAIIAGVFRAFQPIFNLVVDTLGGVLVTVLGNLAKAVEYVTPGIVAITQVITNMLTTIVRWVRDLLEWVGILDAEKAGIAPGASVGASAKNANTTDPSSIIAAAQRAAFSLGSGAKPEVAIGRSIDARVKTLNDTIKELPAEFAKALAKYIKDLAPSWAGGSGSGGGGGSGAGSSVPGGAIIGSLVPGVGPVVGGGLGYLRDIGRGIDDFFGRSSPPKGAV